jgi:hypothetical protein
MRALMVDEVYFKIRGFHTASMSLLKRIIRCGVLFRGIQTVLCMLLTC